jgi:hypothetical protein
MDKVNTPGEMEENMMEIGPLTKCMVTVSSHGLMVELI